MCTTESYLPYQWLYQGAYQPLQPVAVLPINLLNNPQSLKPQSLVSFLRRLFLFSAERPNHERSLGVSCWPDQRYASAGAKQAWVRLEKLRSKAWQKLGLDRSVLWMRSSGRLVSVPENVGRAEPSTLTSQAITQQPLPLEQNEGQGADVSPSAEPQK